MVALRVKLMQEQLNLLLDTIIRVFKEFADVDYLAFQLEHIIKDQVGDNH